MTQIGDEVFLHDTSYHSQSGRRVPTARKMLVVGETSRSWLVAYDARSNLSRATKYPKASWPLDGKVFMTVADFDAYIARRALRSERLDKLRKAFEYAWAANRMSDDQLARLVAIVDEPQPVKGKRK